jgi:hypothetical protein
MAWPLLVVAAVQVVGLLMLATVLRAGRTRHGLDVKPTDEAADVGSTAGELILAC